MFIDVYVYTYKRPTRVLGDSSGARLEDSSEGVCRSDQIGCVDGCVLRT